MQKIISHSSITNKFSGFSGIALSSAKQALKVLQEKDYIYRDNKLYRILDPLIKYVLTKCS